MSVNIAKETLLETFKKNLLTCDGNVARDFIIESEDSKGEKAAVYHVHSYILTMRFNLSLILDLRCYIVKLRIQGCRYWV